MRYGRRGFSGADAPRGNTSSSKTYSPHALHIRRMPSWYNIPVFSTGETLFTESSSDPHIRHCPGASRLHRLFLSILCGPIDARKPIDVTLPNLKDQSF